MPIPSRFNIQNVLGVPGATGPAGPAGPTGPAGSAGSAGWPFGSFFTAVAPPAVGAFTPVNFTQNGTQPAPPTFTAVGGGAGVQIYSPGGSGGFQAQEIAIPTPASAWTLTVGITYQGLWQVSQGGIYFRDTVSGEFAAFGPKTDGAGAGASVRVIDLAYSYGTVAGGITSTPGQTNGGMSFVPMLLQCTYDGASALHSNVSFDGVRFFNLIADSPSSGYGVLPNRVGLFCYPQGGSGTSPINDTSLLCWHWSLTQP